MSWVWVSGGRHRFQSTEVEVKDLCPDLAGMMLVMGIGVCTKEWFLLETISDTTPRWTCVFSVEGVNAHTNLHTQWAAERGPRKGYMIEVKSESLVFSPASISADSSSSESSWVFLRPHMILIDL